MKCNSCDGTGESANKGQNCFECNGSGLICDECGEAAEDSDTCESCMAEYSKAEEG